MVSYTKQERTVIIFYRALLGGNVKTRLGDVLGHIAALACYRCILEYLDRELEEYSVVHAIDQAASDIVCYWKPDMVQQGDSLTLRMRNAFSEVLSDSTHKTLLIGSDMPYLQKHDIEHAFQSLDTADICVFPSSDGGYSLIGMKDCHYDILTTTPIEHSLSPYQSVLQSTLALGYTMYEGRVIDDIDTKEDLRAFLSSRNKSNNQEKLSRSLSEQIDNILWYKQYEKQRL